ncbi:hypothetical protein T11_4136 [Trichinella zimbabwensis]|uniref:Uncharacterized protein n=1 Tax=Trichinella zimbabwensis TaxID=268475 RepID=A0A0V1GXF2_9BILA|nr:hypothetical protein T11_4136 [Trichinella zimbabwensis]
MGETTVSVHSIEQYLLACCNDSSQETDESNIRYHLRRQPLHSWQRAEPDRSQQILVGRSSRLNFTENVEVVARGCPTPSASPQETFPLEKAGRLRL